MTLKSIGMKTKKIKHKKFPCDCKSCKKTLWIGDLGGGDYEIRAKDWMVLRQETLKKIFKNIKPPPRRNRRSNIKNGVKYPKK